MSIQFHLVKTEPTTYSFEKLEKEKKCSWDGVRNYAARKNLRAMQKNDLVLVYHSGEDKCVTGIAKVIREAYPDPTANGEDWSAIDLTPVKRLKNPVPLSIIKNEKKLSNIYLVRQGRLSVMPLTEKEFNVIVDLGK